jgi:RNA-dependent RNA polymerase
MHSYPPVDVLDLGRKCTIDDVCDFVVQYIESDILGLLSDRHLTIAGAGSPLNLH